MDHILTPAEFKTLPELVQESKAITVGVKTKPADYGNLVTIPIHSHAR